MIGRHSRSFSAIIIFGFIVHRSNITRILLYIRYAISMSLRLLFRSPRAVYKWVKSTATPQISFTIRHISKNAHDLTLLYPAIAYYTYEINRKDNLISRWKLPSRINLSLKCYLKYYRLFQVRLKLCFRYVQSVCLCPGSLQFSFQVREYDVVSLDVSVKNVSFLVLGLRKKRKKMFRSK